jgi:hypothetical protein
MLDLCGVLRLGASCKTFGRDLRITSYKKDRFGKRPQILGLPRFYFHNRTSSKPPVSQQIVNSTSTRQVHSSTYLLVEL